MTYLFKLHELFKTTNFPVMSERLSRRNRLTADNLHQLAHSDFAQTTHFHWFVNMQANLSDSQQAPPEGMR